MENAEHVILPCNGNTELREFCAIDRMPYGVGSRIVSMANDLLATLLGKMCDDMYIDYMLEFYRKSMYMGKFNVYKSYQRTKRSGMSVEQILSLKRVSDSHALYP